MDADTWAPVAHHGDDAAVHLSPHLRPERLRRLGIQRRQGDGSRGGNDGRHHRGAELTADHPDGRVARASTVGGDSDSMMWRYGGMEEWRCGGMAIRPHLHTSTP